MRQSSRIPTLVAAAALIALSLSACQSSSASCSSGSCNVTMSGKGSAITIKTTQVRTPYGSFQITFDGAANGSATLSMRGEKGTCTQGQSISLAQLAFICTSVKDDQVKFSITAE